MSIDKKLDELLDRLRLLPVTPEMVEESRRSSVYGSASMENPNITRDDVDKAAERLKNNIKQQKK